MSTATVPSNIISYVPLGEKTEIHLSLERVAKYLVVPTKSGKMPSAEQVMKFMMLCKAQSLNPWVNDAYLVGYDSKDGPSFSLITAHQAFLKRAEASDEFDGIESGVIVKRSGEITERSGKVVYDGETLVGGWAKVHRKDRKIACYDSVQFSTYNTGRSRWAADPSGMIVKVAEAAALRKSFPSNLASLYCQEEMEHVRNSKENVIEGEIVERTTPVATSRTERLKEAKRPAPEPVAIEQVEDTLPEVEAPEPPAVDDDISVKVNAVRQALKLAVPSQEKRAAIYAEIGIEDPTDDSHFDLYAIGSLWDRISEINEGNKE